MPGTGRPVACPAACAGPAVGTADCGPLIAIDEGAHHMADLTGQTLLNRYRVIEFIGRGGMAEVYKAWDEHRAARL